MLLIYLAIAITLAVAVGVALWVIWENNRNG